MNTCSLLELFHCIKSYREIEFNSNDGDDDDDDDDDDKVIP